MTMLNQAQKELVLSQSKPPSTYPKRSDSSPDDQFIRKILYADEKIAAGIIENYAASVADTQLSTKILPLEMSAKELDERYEHSKERLLELEKNERTTPREIKRQVKASNNQSERVCFKQWMPRDQIMMVSLLLALFATLVMGTANVYSNLMASGQVVFLDSPWLAVFISLLMPTGSIAIKFLSHGFSHHRHKKLFTVIVYAFTACLFLAWTMAFAQNFSGVSGGIDWDSLGDSSGKGAVLVWLQLVTEIMVATALALAAEEISLKYAPDFYSDNPEYIHIASQLKQFKTQHEKLSEARNEVHGQLRKAQAEHRNIINTILASYSSLRTRFNQANQF